MVRNAVLTGNPVAPLFNRWFPNPYFHAYMEQGLARLFTTYGGFTWKGALYELSMGGRLQGIFGPLLLVFPLGLLALRRRAGRLLWAAALLLAVPWFWNHGARFLMPSFPFLAFVLAMMLPRPAACACLVLQAVTCWPHVIALYDTTHMWRLSGFPWQSALRVEPESDYLWRETDDFKIARMVNGATHPDDRIFSLTATPAAYVDRESLDFWHSAQSDTLVDTLRVAGQYLADPFYDVKASWPPQPLRGLRIRLGTANPNEWCIHELQLYSGEDRIYNSPQWRLRGWPNVSELVLALDNNLATRWRTWEPMRRGMYVELDLDHTQLLSGAIMVSHTPVFKVPFEFYGLGLDGKWRRLPDPAIELRKHEDLRMAATRAVRRAGFTCLLAPADFEGLGLLGGKMRDHAEEWGLETAGQAGDIYLFRIR
jgi:hypothetical protein